MTYFNTPFYKILPSGILSDLLLTMWQRNYQPLPQDRDNDADRWDSSINQFCFLCSHPDSTRPVVRSNRLRTFLHFGFVIIAVCTALEGVLLISLCFRYARSVWFPAHLTNLETPSTHINFDLLYRNGTKTNSQFPPIQGLPRALEQVSAASAEPDKVYPQWPVSYLAAYGTIPYHGRRILVDPR